MNEYYSTLSISGFQNKDGSNSCIVRTEFSDDEIVIEILSASDNTGFRGVVTKRILGVNAAVLNKSSTELFAIIQTALTNPGDHKKYKYAMENNSFSITEQLDIMDITLVKVNITPKADMQNHLIQSLMNTVAALQTSLKNKDESNGKLEEKFEKLKECYDQVLQERKTLEEDLYGRFMLLLNSKKEKIEELKATVDMIKETEQ